MVIVSLICGFRILDFWISGFLDSRILTFPNSFPRFLVPSLCRLTVTGDTGDEKTTSARHLACKLPVTGGKQTEADYCFYKLTDENTALKNIALIVDKHVWLNRHSFQRHVRVWNIRLDFYYYKYLRSWKP